MKAQIEKAKKAKQEQMEKEIARRKKEIEDKKRAEEAAREAEEE